MAFAKQFAAAVVQKVVFNEGIKVIGANAFFETEVEAVNLPVSVKTIGNGAFYGGRVSSLTIPVGSNLSFIGEKAFSFNVLTTVDLRNAQNLRSIETSVFEGNLIKTLYLPDGIETIKDNAFASNVLEEVQIPDSVTEMGDGVFYRNKRYVLLTSNSPAVITDVKPGEFGSIIHPVEIWIKGIDDNTKEEILSLQPLKVNYNKEVSKELIPCLDNTIFLYPPALPNYISDDRLDIKLTHENVEKYKKSTPFVFHYRSTAKNPVINGLTTIEVKQGGEVDLKTGVSAKDGSGQDITSRIVITPSTVNTDVPGTYKVTYSVRDDFGRKTEAIRLVLVDTDIMETETGNNWKLKDFTYAFDPVKGASVTDLSKTGQEHLKVNKNIVLPEFNPLIPERPVIHFIAANAFANQRLESVTFPNSLIAIEDGAFKGNRLQELQFPKGLAQIGSGAFSDNMIFALDFPDSLRVIGANAFLNNKLTRINFGNGVSEIQGAAFQNNTLVEVKVPDSVSKMGEWVFSYNHIRNYTWSRNLTEIPVATFFKNHIIDFRVPDWVTSLGDGAFRQNRIGGVHVPGNVKYIGRHCFYENPIMTVAFEEGVENIDNGAFMGMSLVMSELRFPSTVKRIGDEAFGFFETGMASTYLGNIDNLILNQGLTSLGKEAFSNLGIHNVVLPSSLQVIPETAFFNNPLKSLNIPEGVKIIGTSAFDNNLDLDQLILPESLELIGVRAFKSTKVGLRGITIPNKVREIQLDAFYNSEINGRLVIPESVTVIGEGAFLKNGITEVEIRSPLTYIERDTFKFNRIKKVTLPNTLQEIRVGAFFKNNLTEVTLPDSVQLIGSYAFQENIIQRVNVGLNSNLRAIHSYAFHTNPLKEIILPETIQGIDSTAFLNCIGWEYTPFKVRVLIKDENGNIVNPNNLTASSDASYTINQGIVTINRVFDGTTIPIKSPEALVDTIGKEVVVVPESTVAYIPVSMTPIRTVVKESGSEISIPYRPNSDFDPKRYTIDLSHGTENNERNNSTPYGLKEYDVNTPMPIYITVSYSGDVIQVEEPWVIVDLNRPIKEGHIYKVRWSSNMPEIASFWTLEDGQIKIRLKSPITPNYTLEIPLMLYFSETDTPDRFTLDLTGKCYLASGDKERLPLKATDFANDIGLMAKTKTPYVNKYVTGVLGDSTRIQGKEDSEGYLIRGTENRVQYGCKYRAQYYSSAIFEDQIPYYEGRDTDGQIRILRAVFHPESSEGWTLSADGTKVIHRVNVLPREEYETPVITFSFPGAKVGKEACNRILAEFTPRYREGVLAPGEPFLGEETVYSLAENAKGSDSDYLKITGFPVNNAPGGNIPYVTVMKRCMCFYGSSDYPAYPGQAPRKDAFWYGHSMTFSWSWYYAEYVNSNYRHLSNYFRDNDEDRHAEFEWASRITVIRGAINSTLVTDYGLDPRMRYARIQIPDEITSADLKLYSEDDAKGDIIYQGTVYHDGYELTEEQSQRAKSFTLKFNAPINSELFETKSLVYKIYTKLREPNKKQYLRDSKVVNGVTLDNFFDSSVRVGVNGYGNTSIPNWMTASDKESIKVLPYDSNY